jgi:hypothetical protein
VAPSSSPLEATTIQGRVYDENNALVNAGAQVAIRSLNPSNPFQTTVDVVNGSYVANQVPAGVLVEVTVRRAGWTPRTQVATPLPLASQTQGGNQIDFGGGNNPYFISNFPEVSSVNTVYADGKLTSTVRFSEPLDAVNQRRVEKAFSISGSDPLSGIVSIRQNSTFLSDESATAIAWDAAGTTMTFTFAGALRANKETDKNYTLTLGRDLNDDQIVDNEAKPLGMSGAIQQDTYKLAFKRSSMVLNNPATALDRWTQTHLGSANFEVAKDDVAPKLTSVSAMNITIGNTESKRFVLTFSEPMRVYPVATGGSTTLAQRANYVFYLSSDNVAGVSTSGAATSVDTPNQVSLNTLLTFSNTSGATIDYSTREPNVVYVTVPSTFIPTNAKQFKVRVQNVEDPAGNVISSAGEVATDKTADNVKSGTF